jgi:NAD-dependent SIR2 family protein deacetylase/ankyrin repeat protein
VKHTNLSCMVETVVWYILFLIACLGLILAGVWLLLRTHEETAKKVLFFSCGRGWWPLTKFILLAIGTKQNAIRRLLERYNKDGWAPLHFACLSGSLRTVRMLLRTQPQVNNCKRLNNGWTPLHIAAATNNIQLVHLLRKEIKDIDMDAQDLAGHTPLMISSCNGYLELVKLLVAAGANKRLKTLQTQQTAAHFAASNGHTEILSVLLQSDSDEEMITWIDAKGSTLLHTAAVSLPVNKGDLSCVEFLLGVPGGLQCVNAQKRDGYTPLHIAAFHGNEALTKLLLANGAELNLRSRFGTTPLHIACLKGHTKIVRILLDAGADHSAEDNDGLTPLHTACSYSCKTNRQSVVEALLRSGADVNCTDTSNCAPLHIIAYADAADPTVTDCVHSLLENGADPTLENAFGWTPLHCAYHNNQTCRTVLENYLNEHNKEFLASFDKDKPRIIEIRRREAKTDLSSQDKYAVLDGDVSLAGIANKIRQGKIKKIIVMTGAGISVSAGIPDFRSPDTGLYSRQLGSRDSGSGSGSESGSESGSSTFSNEGIAELKEKYGLSSVGDALNRRAFEINPEPLYAMLKHFFYPVITGKIRPTAMHWFLRLLQIKGLLLRNYTQNVDMLETLCGLDEEYVVEAHGSLARAYCTNPSCQSWPVPTTLHLDKELPPFWKQVGEGQVPRCSKCGGVMRPDIVFFGEPLPSRFHEKITSDFRECDLLIVAGTSLTVYPFAGLVGDVSPLTPRLLFNRNSVGVWKNSCRDDDDSGGEKKKTNNNNDEVVGNYRDVQVLGECDEGVWQLVDLLGWRDELKQLIASGERKNASYLLPRKNRSGTK